MLLELEKSDAFAGSIAGILYTENDALGDVVQSDRMELLYGQDYIEEEILGLKFKISPFSFFQTNTGGCEVLYEKARENAKANGLSNCEFIAGDVLKAIDLVDEKPDLIIVDPPRDGIHPKALEKILAFGVDEIVYISCKPTSLARDLETIIRRGYRVDKVCCVDQFPRTSHVETVVLLSQQKPDDTIEIDLDLDELDATSAELKATYQEIKDYVLKEFGLKVSSLYISQVKRKCGIEVGENYNLPKSENARVPQCPKEKEDAIKAALKYFAMI